MNKKTYVIALGGSIMHPGEINTEYLRKFYNFIKKEIRQGRKFIIIVGGGKLSRRFQDAAHKLGELNDEDKDWIGIHSTRLNAHLLRVIFRKEAHPVLLKRRKNVTSFKGHSLIIGAGWHPGWSTDFVAVQSAVDFGIKKVIILGKPAYVYDKDNQKFKNAKPIFSLTWNEYLKLIPKKWSPGMHAPVDPVAANLAKKEKTEVVVADGYDLENVKKIINAEKFKGSTIF